MCFNPQRAEVAEQKLVMCTFDLSAYNQVYPWIWQDELVTLMQGREVHDILGLDQFK